MSEMISYCGLPCHDCGALLATKADDDKKRAEVAAEWSKAFNADLKPGDINCMGCTSGGDVLFAHCKVCEVRKCVVEKALANCAYCDDYACDKLEAIFKMAPEAKTRLDAIRE